MIILLGIIVAELFWIGHNLEILITNQTKIHGRQ